MTGMQRGRAARGQRLAGWEGCPWLSVARRALWLLWLLVLPQCCSSVVNSCCFTVLLFPHLLSDPNYALACFPVYFQGKSSFWYKLISTMISKSLTSLILFNSNHIGMNKSWTQRYSSQLFGLNNDFSLKLSHLSFAHLNAWVFSLWTFLLHFLFPFGQFMCLQFSFKA